MSNALQLFRDRHLDYIEIASLLNTTEAEVEKLIHRMRQEEIDAKAKQKREARLEQQCARYRRNRDELREIRRRHA